MSIHNGNVQFYNGKRLLNELRGVSGAMIDGEMKACFVWVFFGVFLENC
jgi:hypothetical protein